MPGSVTSHGLRPRSERPGGLSGLDEAWRSSSAKRGKFSVRAMFQGGIATPLLGALGWAQHPRRKPRDPGGDQTDPELLPRSRTLFHGGMCQPLHCEGRWVVQHPRRKPRDPGGARTGPESLPQSESGALFHGGMCQPLHCEGRWVVQHLRRTPRGPGGAQTGPESLPQSEYGALFHGGMCQPLHGEGRWVAQHPQLALRDRSGHCSVMECVNPSMDGGALGGPAPAARAAG